MARYSMTLRDCIATLLTFDGVKANTLSSRDFIEEGRKRLFNFSYPIYDQDYKKVFETHFIRRFYMKEIGFETDDLFKFQLETWLLIHMPYFNKLFESELLVFDPLKNTDMKVSQNRTTDKDQSQTGTTKGTNENTHNQDSTGTLTEDRFNRDLESNTPDSRLAITTENGQGVIEYASHITENNESNTKDNSSNTTGTSKDTTDVTSTNNGTVNEVEDFIESRIGKTGTQSYSSMVKEYRETLLRIENDIFKEMQQLFMLVY